MADGRIPRFWRAFVRFLLSLILIGALWSQCTESAIADDSLESLGVTHWTVNDGLPNGVVRALAQTQDGRLWVGTHDGLASFDGFEFETYLSSNIAAIPNDTISALNTDTDGALLIATHGGLVRREQQAGNMSPWHQIEAAGPSSTNSIVALGDSIWLSSGRRGIQKLRGGRLDHYAPATSSTSAFSGALVVAGGDGAIRVTHPQLGLQHRLNGHTETIIAPEAMPEPSVTALAVDRHGRTWLGLSNGRIALASRGRARIFPRFLKSATDTIRTLLFDRAGQLWIGTLDSGLLRFDGNTIERFPDGHALNDANVLALLEDHERNLWVGTSQGLYRLHDVPVGQLQISGTRFERDTWSIHAVSEEDYWIATESDGLIHAKQGGRRHYGARDGLGADRVYAVTGSTDGRIWATPSQGGLRVLVGDGFVPVASASALAETSIPVVFTDSRDRLWLGGFVSGGLQYLEKDTLKYIPYPLSIGRASATSFAETADGTIWIGTYNAGLLQVEHDGVRQFTRREGLLGEYISALHADDHGALWVAVAGGGLNRFADGRLDRFTVADGLPSHNILSIQHDPSGRLWMCTGRGLFALRIGAEAREKSGALRISSVVGYGKQDGMPNADCTGIGRSIDRKSASPLLVFSMTRGVITIDTDRIDRTPPPPTTEITALALDDTPSHFAARLDIGPDVRRLRIGYSAISLREPHRLRFRHKLEGFDAAWSAPIEDREVSYTNLAPGHYRFLVQAKIGEGNWGSIARLPVFVSPPFYRSKPFYFLVLLTAILILMLVHRLTLAQLRERNAVLAERSRIAREIHDTLANGLLGIRLHLDVAKALVDDAPAEAKSYLDRARDIANESAEEARRSVYAMREGSTSHPDVIRAIVRQVEILVLQAPLELHIQATPVPLAMASERQHELLRLVREAVINTINHAMATSLRIGIRLQDDELDIEIADDGKGFEGDGGAYSGARHYGLAGMRERAERLGADLTIITHPGEGTRIHLRVPTKGCSRTP
ncbi:MAG: hypothetical protein E6Q88_15110 [Lysobacteraceae bacterium]|nr:MAG: hypothetical protein E6Q88_15110 [Xanthomonadaceae bacterium]